MSVTIKDLARETGLTAATISAYFNGAIVRPYNREKIDKAVEKLGYIRNDYARALRTHKSMTVGVIIPEFYNSFAARVVTEIENALRSHRYGIIISDCGSSVKREREAVRFLLSKTVDGLIVIPSSDSAASLDLAVRQALPVVALDRYTESRNISHVVLSNRKTAREATQAMFDEGKRKIAAIFGDQNIFKARERLLGCREAALAAGAQLLEEPGELSMEGGYKAVKTLLFEHPDLQGVIATNYEMTIGAAVALKEAGIKAGDFAFTGFDAVKMLPLLCPGMRLIVQPLKQMGQVAAETLLSMIDGGPVRNIVLDAELRQ